MFYLKFRTHNIPEIYFVFVVVLPFFCSFLKFFNVIVRNLFYNNVWQITSLKIYQYQPKTSAMESRLIQQIKYNNVNLFLVFFLFNHNERIVVLKFLVG